MADINTTPLVDVMLVLLIIFLIAVPVAIQTIEKLQIPVFESEESKDKVENLQLTVSTTDANGNAAGDPGYSGAVRDGECRVYFGNTTPVSSEELYDQAFERLDSIVQRAGGPEAIKAEPDLIPQVHIRGDVNAPWRCVAGTIYNVQAAGYPTVGFISNPVDPNA
ncbi:biopolymer transporter ExbD [Citromicrobium sp. JL31]|nr:biopolymer transporter ExbD [Citromicrobium sp. JL477]KPM13172.1 biopolymer transporter ExbD [Citromicrobium sp. WPS32]KPM14067.1 biopolymer transporter ExbD [Citromicrobium sp. JL31]KPM17413.1 biopolymer transporter ExbD [Citromicrobium sp. JL1351]KPM21368.1 biopolymer transporter ExbD [Citromicrobium sp. RCC1885]KPM27441.1 biopolymer transporter ExbD [Citromicrobium sp. JL2201]KPM29448.1 biopolymer transporter ExbD [Citromicrobium sp. RCC1878]OAM06761.1 biopolymer transporter ExbD [Citr